MVVITPFDVSSKNGDNKFNFRITVKSESNERIVTYNAIQGTDDAILFPVSTGTLDRVE